MGPVLFPTHCGRISEEPESFVIGLPYFFATSDIVSATSWCKPHEVKYALTVWVGLFPTLRRCGSNCSGCCQREKNATPLKNMVNWGYLVSPHAWSQDQLPHKSCDLPLRVSTKWRLLNYMIPGVFFHIYHLLILYIKHYRIFKFICKKSY